MIVVFVTCKDAAQAERIADAAVGEHLAACGSVVPGLTSIFAWQGKRCRESEALLVLKTQEGKFDALEALVRKLHSYKVPEIVGVPASHASGPYARWVEESVR